MAANERVSRLRERMLVTPAICVERAYYMTKSYQKSRKSAHYSAPSSCSGRYS